MRNDKLWWFASATAILFEQGGICVCPASVTMTQGALLVYSFYGGDHVEFEGFANRERLVCLKLQSCLNKEASVCVLHH